MRRFFFILLAFGLALSGCSASFNPNDFNLDDLSEDDILDAPVINLTDETTSINDARSSEELPSEEATSDSSQTAYQGGEVEVGGSLEYYFDAPEPKVFADDLVGRICFIPAQLETINGGDRFCFTNEAQEILTAFNFKEDASCESDYAAAASITIRNLTNDHGPVSRSDECYASGTCEFNEAEFVNVVEEWSSFVCLD